MKYFLIPETTLNSVLKLLGEIPLKNSIGTYDDIQTNVKEYKESETKKGKSKKEVKNATEEGNESKDS